MLSILAPHRHGPGTDGDGAAVRKEQTDDERGVDHAQRLGATVAIPPIDNGKIVFAHPLDPLGNRSGVWRPKE